MENKKEVLEQINEIESLLLDNEKFMPYNYNILILWGMVSAILFLSMEYMFSYGTWYALSYLAGVIFITTLVERYYIKQENLKYDMQKYTKIQNFVESLYIFITIISLFLTYVFYTNDLIVYSYLIWIFMIAFSHYIVGFVINNKYFRTLGLINISLVFALFTISILFSPDVLNNYIKYIAVLFSSFGCIFIRFKSKQEV